ncbi:MAG: hypothetical protein ACI9X0_000896 [Kiritimatiellia bacterium]
MSSNPSLTGSHRLAPHRAEEQGSGAGRQEVGFPFTGFARLPEKGLSVEPIIGVSMQMHRCLYDHFFRIDAIQQSGGQCGDVC